MAKRPPVPADLEREVLLEAGHRCAIHTCRQTPIEIAHIVPWAVCKGHVFGNLIALCPTCHARYDKGEIDRKSMTLYKQRLLVYAGRFTQFELRVLRKMADTATDEIWMLDDLELLLSGLLESGYLIFADQTRFIGAPDSSARKLYKLTTRGREFVDGYLPRDDSI